MDYQFMGAGIDEDADDVLLSLMAADSYDPSTQYERATPIEPHWAVRSEAMYSPWEGNWTYRPTFAYY